MLLMVVLLMLAPGLVAGDPTPATGELGTADASEERSGTR
jgi:hypothetical protein